MEEDDGIAAVSARVSAVEQIGAVRSAGELPHDEEERIEEVDLAEEPAIREVVDMVDIVGQRAEVGSVEERSNPELELGLELDLNPSWRCLVVVWLVRLAGECVLAFRL